MAKRECFPWDETENVGSQHNMPTGHSFQLTAPSGPCSPLKGGFRGCALQQQRLSQAYLQGAGLSRGLPSLISNWSHVESALESVNKIFERKSNGLFTLDDFIEAGGGEGVLWCRNRLSFLESFSKLDHRGMWCIFNRMTDKITCFY